MTHATRPRHALNMLATACAALVSLSAQAAAPTQAELDSIVLYGDVSIARDSTAQWGVWEQFEPTAAGSTPVGPALRHSGEVYRPLAQVTLGGNAPEVAAVLADNLCVAGGLCGFGAFEPGSIVREQASAVGNDSVPATEEPALNRLPYYLTIQAKGQEGSAPPDSLRINSTPLRTGGDFMQADSGVLTREGGTYYVRLTETDNSSISHEFYGSTSGNEFFDIQTVQAAWYDAYVTSYVSGDGVTTSQSQRMEGVAGVTTSTADMSALRAGNATATYLGYDSYGRYAVGAPDGKGDPNVRLNVNFGTGRFTGSFNGGADSTDVANPVQVSTTSAGARLDGRVGFNITDGVITGSNFKSTSFSATDGTVKGALNGAFFGPSAAAAGGVADVVKTRTDGRYSNARFVSPFLAVRDNLIRSIKAE